MYIFMFFRHFITFIFFLICIQGRSEIYWCDERTLLKNIKKIVKLLLLLLFISQGPDRNCGSWSISWANQTANSEKCSAFAYPADQNECNITWAVSYHARENHVNVKRAHGARGEQEMKTDESIYFQVFICKYINT